MRVRHLPERNQHRIHHRQGIGSRVPRRGAFARAVYRAQSGRGPARGGRVAFW